MPNYDYELKDIQPFRKRVAVDAEVGIEIEVEGQNLPLEPFSGWLIHNDGSLRQGGLEYIFKSPVNRRGVRPVLENFSEKIKGAVVNQSYRTSVHVHLNCRPMKVRHIYNQMFLYTLYEDVMAELCGKDRVGNLFCLRAKDAQYWMDQFRTAMRLDNLQMLNQEQLRYSACNPYSLFSHGTLEFRSFRGTTNIDEIDSWVKVLLAIRDAAQRYSNPVEIMRTLEDIGLEEFTRAIFTGDQINTFNDGWATTVDKSKSLMWHLATANKWDQKKSENPTVILNNLDRANVWANMLAERPAPREWQIEPDRDI